MNARKTQAPKAAQTLSLQAALHRIATAHEKTESTAGLVFNVIRQQGIQDAAGFDVAVAEAYAEAGWSQRIGRPMEGDVQAPSIVKTYVSTFRRAFRLGVRVAELSNLYELREAIKKAKAALPAKPGPEKRVDGAVGDFYRGAWHDVLAIRSVLPEASQAALDAEVRAVIQKYVNKAPAQLHLVVVNKEAPVKKRA